MTVQQMLEDAWVVLGEPDDWTPYDAAGVFDITTDGAQTLLGWLNSGYRFVAKWVYSDGSLSAHPLLQKKFNFQIVKVTATVAPSGNTSSVVVLDTFTPTITSLPANVMEGWKLKVTSGTGSGQSWLIGSHAIIAPWAIDIVGTAAPVLDSTSVVELVRRRFRMIDPNGTDGDLAIQIQRDPINDVYAIKQLVDMSADRQIWPGQMLNRPSETRVYEGNPGQFWYDDGGIEFDYAPSSGKWFMAKYDALPEALTSGSDQPKLAAIYHDAITLWMVWHGRVIQGNFNLAYATRKDMESQLDRITGQSAYRNANYSVGLYPGGNE